MQAGAQIRLAAYGGIHSANIIEKNNIPGWDTTQKKFYSSQTGLHLGVMLEIPIGHKGFYFQPALDYNSKGRQYSKTYDTSGADKDTIYLQTNLKLSYIEMPLFITYKLPLSSNHKNFFFLSAGPYFSFFYNGSFNTQSRTANFNPNPGPNDTIKYHFNSDNANLSVGNSTGKYKTFDIGVNARAGFELGNVMLSAYFSQGLTNFYSADYDATFHHQLFGGTFGIWLNKATPVTKPATPKKDTDNDGIPDDEDACPLQPGTVTWRGCPVPDTDHDGIDDEHDSCRTIAGVARYNGCPVPDSDGDGIDDEHDSCKTVPGIAKYNGCPIPDRDGDGINDEDDKCPDQPGPANNQGCPVIKKEIPVRTDYAIGKILFQSSSDKLTTSSYAAIDALADTLKAHPELHLTIGGHTDITGDPTHNLELSQQRADAVRNYLIKKGIPAERITAIGYGKEHPIGNNKTEEGKAMNRRVELKLEVEK